MGSDRVCGPGCLGCLYLEPEGFCGYCLAVGRSRAAQGARLWPGGGCRLKRTQERELPRALTVSLPRKKKKRKPLREAGPKEDKRKRRRSRLDGPEVTALYEGGASDGEIAAAAGVDRGTVQKWRQRRGLAPNYHPGGVPKEKRRRQE